MKYYAKTREFAVVSASDPTAIAQDGYETLGEALRFAAEAGPEFVAAEVWRETTVIEAFSGTPRPGTELGREVGLDDLCAFEGDIARVVDSRVEGAVRYVLVESASGRAWEWEGDVTPFGD